jgi:hypothetical protein
MVTPSPAWQPANSSAAGRSESIAEVVAHELALLQPGVRADREAAVGLLHEAFREFGASGRVWDRAQIVDSLAADPGDTPAEPEDLQAVMLTDDVILLTYRARRPDRTSLRSSLWVRGEAGWKLLFHQGTVSPWSGMDQSMGD